MEIRLEDLWQVSQLWYDSRTKRDWYISEHLPPSVVLDPTIPADPTAIRHVTITTNLECMPILSIPERHIDGGADQIAKLEADVLHLQTVLADTENELILAQAELEKYK